MRKFRLDWQRVLLSCIGLVMFAIAPTTLVAQTWKKPEQMLVPVVAEGTPCNGTSDTIGLKSDRSNLLVCKAGVWTKQAGTASSVSSYTQLPSGSLAGYFNYYEGICQSPANSCTVVSFACEAGWYPVYLGSNKAGMCLKW